MIVIIDRLNNKIIRHCVALICLLAFLTSMVPNAIAASEPEHMFTYSQALRMAIDNSSALRAIEESAAQLEVQREFMRRHVSDPDTYIDAINFYQAMVDNLHVNIARTMAEVEYIRAAEAAGGVSFPGQITALEMVLGSLHSGLATAQAMVGTHMVARDATHFNRNVTTQRIEILDRQIDILHVSEIMLRASVEMNLRVALLNINNLKRSIILAEAAISLSEENLRRLEALYQFGRVRATEVSIAANAVRQEGNRLEALLLTLDNERISLNQMLGQPLTRRVQISFSTEMTLTSAEQATVNIEALMRNDLALRLLELNIGINRANLEIARLEMVNARRGALGAASPATERARARNYERLRIEHENAQGSLDATIRELSDSRVSSYANIRMGVNEYDRLLLTKSTVMLELEELSELLSVTQALYNSGRATALNVRTVELSVQRALFELERIVDALWLLQFRLTNPFLL